MHATTEQLLTLRDGLPIDGPVAQHVELCQRCSLELHQLRKTQQALRDLPQQEPSPQVFAQLTERLAQEQQAARRSRLRQPLALAAAAAVVAALALWLVPQESPTSPLPVQVAQQLPEPVQPEPVVQAVASADLVAERDALLRRSMSLEAVAQQLAELGAARPDSSTRDALRALETQLALVDYNLSAAQIDQYVPAELNTLLARRVSTLENIVGVQRAELARQGYHGFQVMTASNISEEQTW